MCQWTHLTHTGNNKQDLLCLMQGRDQGVLLQTLSMPDPWIPAGQQVPTADGLLAFQREQKGAVQQMLQIFKPHPAGEHAPHAKLTRPMGPALRQVRRLAADVALLCRRSTTPCCSR